MNTKLENLLEKLKIDSKCELSIDEIKLLYSVEAYNNSDVRIFCEKRDKYKDLSKIYDPFTIALSPDEITMDTKILIGDIKIDKKYPTYNLKYIYGDVIIPELNDNINFDNLEYAFGMFNILISKDIMLEDEKVIQYVNDFINKLFNLEDSFISLQLNNYDFNTLLLYVSYGEIIWNKDIALDACKNSSLSILFVPVNEEYYFDAAMVSVEIDPHSLKYVKPDIDRYSEVANKALEKMVG